MDLRIGITVSGEGFDPYSFNETLPDYLKGKAQAHKGKPKGLNGEQTHYWKSIEQDSFDKVYVEDALCALIKGYEPYLSLISETPELKRYAYIYGYIFDMMDINGFFINRNLIDICSRLNLEIDIGLSQKIK